MKWWDTEQQNVISRAQETLRTFPDVLNNTAMCCCAVEFLTSADVILKPIDFSIGLVPRGEIAIYRRDHKVMITVEGSFSDPRTRWTILHELGHALLHRNWTSQPRYIEEHEADLFAVQTVALLAPEQLDAADKWARVHMQQEIEAWRDLWNAEYTVCGLVEKTGYDPHPIPASILNRWGFGEAVTTGVSA